MDAYLFSYGTLQKESVQMALFGRTLQGDRDRLPGYVIAMVEISDQAFLAKGENKKQRTLVKTGNKADVIEGTVLKLTADELLLADQYEPANYKRISITLDSGKTAWIYVADENDSEYLSGSK